MLCMYICMYVCMKLHTYVSYLPFVIIGGKGGGRGEAAALGQVQCHGSLHMGRMYVRSIYYIVHSYKRFIQE